MAATPPSSADAEMEAREAAGFLRAANQFGASRPTDRDEVKSLELFASACAARLADDRDAHLKEIAALPFAVAGRTAARAGQATRFKARGFAYD